MLKSLKIKFSDKKLNFKKNPDRKVLKQKYEGHPTKHFSKCYKINFKQHNNYEEHKKNGF